MTRTSAAASLALAVSLLVLPMAASAQDGGVFLSNLTSGKCIDVLGDPGVDNGLPLQLWDCEWSGLSATSNPTDQTWADPGFDVAVFIGNTLSGRCLDVVGDPGVDSGSPLQLWDCELSGFSASSNPTDQGWVFRSDGFIQNTLSGRCIDVVGDPGVDSGARLQLSDCELSGFSASSNPTDQTWTH
jgi:hypothetical protein